MESIDYNLTVVLEVGLSQRALDTVLWGRGHRVWGRGHMVRWLRPFWFIGGTGSCFVVGGGARGGGGGAVGGAIL